MERIAELFHRYFEGKASADEEQELMQLVEKVSNIDLEIMMKQEWEVLTLPDANVPDGTHLLQQILYKPAPRSRILNLRRSAAAAAILLLLSVGGYYLYQQHHANPPVTVTNILPGYNKAMLTLEDGRVVSLDSTGSQLIRQGACTVSQQNGELNYDSHQSSEKIAYNTLKTPRGGQYRVTLPDGTAVWLNAASSIRYPTTFKGTNRQVEMTGEAYFEVAANADKPFVVTVNDGVSIRVLGTHFNVNAYPEEGSTKTTLLAGAVAVGATAIKPLILRPGQQAQVLATTMNIINNVNTAQVVAWKNGQFDFSHADIKTVMNQLSRWYDVDVRYDGTLPTQMFRGKLSKELRLSEVLEILRDVNVKYKLDNRTIIVYGE
ncbi:FecR family protein [Chitinophaga sp. sic0106]|uniref:FecR family protein n=1 Tax=Chitinophaga sp. sic0106 TaxID=2854785 RepID=UPI001C4723A9|nr:FecR family protein [Chitinophaga sp. sic0106]MBV7529665.1 FecR domain-containing protein [Chitinophaga sp. sic0106]